jgi:hypothetical protein
MNVDRSHVLKLASALSEIIEASNDSQPAIPQVHRYVTIALASQITGFTENAIRRKIQDGVWIEGRHWKRAPDGRIVIDMEGYAKWVERVAA